jgi:hypothetical protein
MRRLLLAIFMVLAAASGWAQAQSGTTGSLSWTLSEGGTLTIRGTGVMPDYDSYSHTPPWYSYREKITEVVVEAGVTTIGWYAFHNCSSLLSVTLPASVTSIGDVAFYNCRSLTSITLPEGVNSIDHRTFGWCYALTEILVAPNNPVYSSEAGVLFNKDKTTLIRYPIGKAGVSYAVPGTATSIAVDAFSESYLEAVTIPASVISIEAGAFFNCSRLTSIALSEGVGSIGGGAFFNCNKLPSITIPASVTAIGDNAWGDCPSLSEIRVASNNSVYSSEEGVLFNKDKTTLVRCPQGKISTSYTLPASVTSIGAYAFYDCNRLESMTIPASVTSIGESAFSGCSSLTGITVASNNPAYSSEEGVLFDKSKTLLIQYPRGKTGTDYTLPASVTSIEGGAFDHCSRLESIILPASVTSIGHGAFFCCTNLASITLPAVISIGGDAFAVCSSLTSVTLPASVTSIGALVFTDCLALTDITVHWITTPPAINRDVFHGTTLATITLHVPAGTKAMYEMAEGWKEFNIVGESGPSCPSGTFGAGDALTWELCEGVLTIGGAGVMPDYTDAGISAPWYAYREAIAAIVIASGVEHIGAQAFFSYSNLASVTIPASVTSIGWEVFQNCRNLTAITLPPSLSTIRRAAFCNTGLTSITIPASVTSIDPEVFVSCLSLTSIFVEAGNTVYSSDDGVLYNKNKEILHSYPGGRSGGFIVPDFVTTIGNYAFDNCRNLSSVTIPGSVTTIGYSAFQSCYNLSSFAIPASVISIGGNIFNNCIALTDIRVDAGNTVYASEDGVLYNKNKDVLQTFPAGRSGDFVIPASVTTIGSGAFWGCSTLVSVTIPASVTSIEWNAFIGCHGLTDITVKWKTTPATISSSTFSGLTLSHITLHVPAGTAAIYETADVWKGFAIEEKPCLSGTFGTDNALAWELCDETLTIRGAGAIPDYADLIAFSKTGTVRSDSDTGHRPPWYAYREAITTLVIEPEITGIGAQAFAGCIHLTDVTVGWTATLPPIDAGIFAGLTLADITLHIPDGTESVYKAAEVWQEFRIVEDPNPACHWGVFGAGNALTWELCDGTLTIGGTGMMPDFSYGNAPWYAFSQDITAVVIASGVESIGAYAFYNHSKLVSVTLPASITSIGTRAFSSCYQLLSLAIPEAVTAIGEEAFAACFELTEITVAPNNPAYSSEDGVLFDKNKTTLLHYPMEKAGNSYPIPASVTTLGTGAFYNCNRLTSMILPASVTTIEANVFAACYGLKSITLPAGVLSIGERAFADCRDLTEITVNWTTTPPAINSNVFSGLTPSGIALRVPDDKKTVYEAAEVWKAFRIVEHSETYCPGGPFGADNALRWELCEGVLTISGTGAMPDFSYNATPWNALREDMTEVVVASGVENIGAYAFYYCRNLASIALPDGIRSVGNNAFEACSGLTSIALPESVLSIGDGAFRFCNGLTSFVIPEKVTSIGTMAFSSCQSLKSITLPASLQSMGERAFSDCSKVIEITVNWTTTPPAITGEVFRNLTLSNITLRVPDGTVAVYTAAEVWKEFRIVEQSDTSCPGGTFGADDALRWELCDGTLTISGTGMMPDFNYPDYSPWSLYGEDIHTIIIESGVESIGADAFYYSSGATSVVIPSSVTAIGAEAFLGCSRLVSIALPASVTSIGSAAFGLCNSLTDIAVATDNPAYCSENGVLFDKDKATIVQYPAGIPDTHYTLPASVTAIGNDAFIYCFHLTSVTLPSSVISIGADAFYYCNGLTEMVIPASVTSIGERAFTNCSRLVSITLPETITSIEATTFAGCNRLASLVIPESVTSIGESAFASCLGLADLTVLWTITPPAITEVVFAYVTLSNITLHVPKGTKALYEAAEVWKEFLMVESPVGIKNIPPANRLNAYVQNGRLQVSGLTAGESVDVHDASGRLVHRSLATGGEKNIVLPTRGVYLVRAGHRSVKVVF